MTDAPRVVFLAVILRQHESRRPLLGQRARGKLLQLVKAELVTMADWATHDEAEAAVADCLRFYNHHRLHAALDYRSPAQYEAAGAAAV